MGWRRNALSSLFFAAPALAALALGSNLAVAQDSMPANVAPTMPSPVQMCARNSTVPYCQAVHGDRSEGWLVQTRSEVLARNGVVSTVQPLAAQAGLRILQQGGNAIDAAVATAAALSVTYPANVGVAGDLFALIYVAKEHKVYQINASGIAPSGLTIAHMNALGYKFNPQNFGPGSGMPSGGITTVSVPGSVWGWAEVLNKFGNMGFKEDLQPAIDYAEQGFPVTEEIQSGWRMKNALPLQGCCKEPDPDAIKTFYINGQRPAVGSIFRNPDMAKTLKLIQAQGRDAFYKGEIAKAIVAKSDAIGGTMTMADLANYKGEWVTPVSTTYHDQYTVYGTRAPSQAWGIVEEMNVLEQCVPLWYPGQTLASLGPANPLYWHALIEAKKVVYAEVYAHNADPNVVPVDMATYTSKEHARSLCGKVDPNKASAIPQSYAGVRNNGDTIYLATADRWGNMVSWINSNFAGWGSGIAIPGYGFVLHNRGGLFNLNPGSPNALAPGKRPYNTLTAVLVTKDGKPFLVTGQHGGDQQGQGNMQVLADILDLGANVQAAGDMARFSHNQLTNSLQMESNLYKLVGPQLIQMGHKVTSSNGGPMGGYEAIMQVPDPTAPAGCDPADKKCTLPLAGIYRAGSNFREDGQSAGY
jgi:gamma-glutamyltranspeptidase/glutathione hydrolase